MSGGGDVELVHPLMRVRSCETRTERMLNDGRSTRSTAAALEARVDQLLDLEMLAEDSALYDTGSQSALSTPVMPDSFGPWDPSLDLREMLAPDLEKMFAHDLEALKNETYPEPPTWDSDDEDAWDPLLMEAERVMLPPRERSRLDQTTARSTRAVESDATRYLNVDLDANK